MVIEIAIEGKPVAMLVPAHTHRPTRRPGAMKGKIHITADFDMPLPDDFQTSFDDG